VEVGVLEEEQRVHLQAVVAEQSAELLKVGIVGR